MHYSTFSIRFFVSFHFAYTFEKNRKTRLPTSLEAPADHARNHEPPNVEIRGGGGRRRRLGRVCGRILVGTVRLIVSMCLTPLLKMMGEVVGRRICKKM